MAVAVGQRCVVRIKITDVELRKARDIKATIVSPQGEEKCQNVSFDEVSGVVYASVDVNSVGSWSMWLGVRFDKELFYTPAFVFAEVEGDAKSCDAPYIVDVEVAGESVSVTPPKVDVDAITREEFEQLSKDIAEKVDKVEGKGLSTNDFTDEYKKNVEEFTIDKELSPTSDNAIANSAVVQGLAGLAERVSEAIGNVSEQLGAEIKTKANKDDYYPDMSVGMADNLVGRGDVQDAHINFRPSAGANTNITDGAARIERIKGKSVVWNQAVSNADFRNGTEGWASTYADIYARDGYMEFVTNEMSSSQFNHSFAKLLTKGHKYIIMCDMERDTTDIYPFYVYFGKSAGGYDTYYGGYYSSDKRHIATAIITTTSEILYMLIYPTISAPAGVTTKVYSVQVIDLTQMFGAGNEPKTASEYMEGKPLNIADECAYNEGEILSTKVDALKSVGDNAYDYTKGYAKVIGGIEYECTVGDAVADQVYFSTDKDNLYQEDNILPRKTNGVYVFPANGYAAAYSMNAPSEKVCVCIKHSYPKHTNFYEENTKDLSWIKGIKDEDGNILFPNGMRSAGSAYDEIRYNRTAKKWEVVKRIGEVDLGSLEWSIYSTYQSGVYSWVAQIYDGMACANNQKANILGIGFDTKNANDIHMLQGNKTIGLAYNATYQTNYLNIYDSQYTTNAQKQDFINSLDNKVCYYELATPIVVELDYPTEETNMDYLVWDFGTEETIATEPSAPFRADIIYEPNAVDDIRWANKKIEDILAGGVGGGGNSDNNFTDADKSKLDNLDNTLNALKEEIIGLVVTSLNTPV